jgi:zinc protease
MHRSLFMLCSSAAHGFKMRALLLSLLIVLAQPVHAAVEVETTSIGHGVKAWYASNVTVPVVDIVLSFEGAGNASDPEGKGGRAAFAAAMLTEGAGNLDSSAFRRALEEKAITLSAEADDDRLKIHIYCLREHAVEAGKLLALALSKPVLAETDQQRMKTDLTSLIARLEERPGYQAARLLSERAFKGHPYANAPYGTAASLASLSAQDVRDYLTTYVTRGNVLVAASGDVDASLLDDMLEPVMEALSGNDAGAVSVTQTNIQGAGEHLRKTVPAPQTTILFAAPAIAREDPRFYAQYLLNQILGGSALFSRLGDEIRRDKGLVYNIDTDLDIKRGAAAISGSLATRNASAEEALAAVKDVLQKLRDKGATTEECADAKSYAIGSFARKLDGSSAITNMLLTMQIYRLGEDYIENREALFGKVSCAEVNAVVEQLLDPAQFVFAIVGGSPEIGGKGPITTAPTPHTDIK